MGEEEKELAAKLETALAGADMICAINLLSASISVAIKTLTDDRSERREYAEKACDMIQFLIRTERH